MALIETSIDSILEQESSIKLPVGDIGDEFVEMYKNLDLSAKEKVDKLDNVQFKQDVLRNASDPKIKAYYDKLSKKERAKLDALPIRDKYLILKNAVKMKEAKEATVSKKPVFSPHSPDFPPPPLVPGTPDYPPPPIDYGTPDHPPPPLSSHTPDHPPPPLSDSNQTNKSVPQELLDNELVPEEILDDEQDTPQPKLANNDIQIKINNIVSQFYASKPFVPSSESVDELEVRFGTKGIKRLSRTDYDNVIKKLKSFGFLNVDPSGLYSLRVNCEYLDTFTGKFRLSDVRTEINGVHNIQVYCKNNNIKELFASNASSLKFCKKRGAQTANKEKIFPVNVDDFNFRVSYSKEETIKQGVRSFIMENWKKSKKVFRYLNRVTFVHSDYPFNVDVSIVKYSNKGADRFGNQGRGDMIPVYTTQDAHVFANPEVYEIEIEIDNRKIGPGTAFNSPDKILVALRKVIKYVLGGLQGTNFPISYPEQKDVQDAYMKLIWNDQFDPKKRIENRNFIGPNSVTLQLKNIAPISDNSNVINVRKDFVVTDKADGQRHLMYINNLGKIYLINTNMNIIFTGAKTDNKDCFNCLLDGELIAHDKNGNFINLYAAFDIYYYNKNDVRSLSFMQTSKKMDTLYNARYQILKLVTGALKPVSIVEINTKVYKENKSIKTVLDSAKQQSNHLFSPIRIVSKEFYPFSNKQTIFSGCNEILSKVRENRFEYETDGLILTHAYFGVGSDKVGDSGPKTKITWDYSFKWKPPQFNTIDFLITTVKGVNGDDVIKPIFEDGLNTEIVSQLTEYKTIELRCGFDEKVNGYINPCQDVIDDKLPDFKNNFEDSKSNNYMPVRFYPTDPYDNNAGLCKIMLKHDESGAKQMFSEENEVFTDNTIVEFSYSFINEQGWRWIPLRVRHDKTTEYRLGMKQYGNSYKVANDNWNSIHNPITEDMICTGLNIPDILVNEDTYYNNTSTGKYMTEAMKNFHNLYVKKMLIKSVSKPGDTLVDFACGKAGDLPKWIASKLSFVFGIDISKDNLENRLNGACARFLNNKKNNKNMPYALFVNGNSAYNIKNGSAMLNDKAIQITKAVFGQGPKESDKIGKGVARQYGVGEEGFNVSSCQFAIHYFFENPDTLQGFLRNVAECTKLNGHFIGTAYDGKSVFNLLKKTKTGESIQIVENGKKIWEITKNYGADNFEDNSSCIGYKIDVFQESINQTISEYLVNFDYINRAFESYGFKLINRVEAKEIGLPEGSGLFSELFANMLEEIKMNKNKAKDYGNAMNMTSFEKKISFLNRYFVYKKIREVNTAKVELDMGEYGERDMTQQQANARETETAAIIEKKENAILKPKVRKLSKKLLLVDATEAIDEQPVAVAPPVAASEPVIKLKKTRAKKNPEPAKKILIIDEDD